MSSPVPGARPGPAPAPAFTRRTLLAATLAGSAALAAACTRGDQGGADAVTPAQADALVRQVTVQEDLVTAFDQAVAASPELATAAAPLAQQARDQLTRLRQAAPGSPAGSSSRSTSGAGGSTAAGGSPVPSDPVGARSWLRAQVAAAATAHATACPEFSGARAALLGSIAAGLRGQDGQLA